MDPTVTSTDLLPLRPLDIDPSSPTSSTSSSTTNLPHATNEPAFHERLSSGLSPRTSPTTSVPIIPPLQPGTTLLTTLGRPFLAALAHRHRPVVYLHSKEPCMPCTPDWYARHADLYHGDTRVAVAEELSADRIGDPTWLEEKRMKALAAHQNQNGNTDGSTTPSPTQPLTASARRRRQPRPSPAVRHQQYNFRVRAEHRCGSEPSELGSSVPMLCYVRDCVTHWELLYVFCYAYNAPYRVLGVMWLGAHDGDWEHVTLRVAKHRDAITHVYFAAHGWRDGTWQRPSQYESEAGRPVVYVAKGSHACYPHAGRWLRIWAGANDLCERGVRWDADRTLLLHVSGSGDDAEDGEVSWLRYSGWWEAEGINSPHQQQWWYREPLTSNTVLRRCFTSFVRPCFGMDPEMWLLKTEEDLQDADQLGETET